jgi:hypothetical protein
MSQDLSAVFREHEAFFEVRPYEVVVQNRGKDGSSAVRRVHAGFDVDIYGTVLKGQHHPDAREYWFICTSMQKLAQCVNTTDCCEVQVIPFPSTMVIDTHRQMLRLGMLRIRITHGRGIEQPAGLSEQRALKEIEAKLREAGSRSQSGRAP